MPISIESIPLNDAATWDLFKNGKTCGVFQCESRLVQTWLKKIKPENIWELSAVIALVRPGALDSGFTEQYVNNKNNNFVPEFGNKIVDEVFKSTNGCLVYQEQLMSLGARLAWSHLEENQRLIKVDELRKAVGKKDQSKVVAIGKEFVDGCLLNKVDQQIAEKLFETIKSCGRYLFNLSHSISYAYISYFMGYIKQHYPHHFYICSLNVSQEKNDENDLHSLVQDAKSRGFTIVGPNINKKNIDFIGDEKTIYFGLSHIKYVSSSLNNIISSLPEINHWSQILKLGLTNTYGEKLRSQSLDALIYTDSFRDVGINFQVLYNIVSFCRCLTDRELDYLFQNLDRFPEVSDFPKLIEEISEKVSVKKRKNALQSEIIILKENLNRKADFFVKEEKELHYLSSIVSGSVVSKYEKYSTKNCFECNQLSFDSDDIKELILLCCIDDVKPHIIKTGNNAGKKMAKITVHDSSGQLENLPVFTKTYHECSDVLIARNTVQLMMSYNRGRGFFVRSVSPISIYE